jgi:hypothetical protein
MLTELSVGRGARPGSRCFASVADRRVKGRTETAHVLLPLYWAALSVTRF